MTTLHREFALEDARLGDGRTIILAAVPFNAEALVDDGDGPYYEAFARGAFDSATRAPHRVALLFRHDDSAKGTLGRGVLIREEASYLHAEMRVSRGSVGDHILDLVSDSMLDGASVGFVPLHDGNRTITRNGQRVVTRTRALLEEISLVPVGAYAGAGVLAVREAEPEPIPEPPQFAQLERMARQFPDLVDISRFRPRN
jgi:HK97 family phage prohead protease